MNDSTDSQTGNVQTPRNSIVQLLIGLLIGGGFAAAAIGLKEQLRPDHRTPGVEVSSVSITATPSAILPSPTETLVPTWTPTLEPTVTPVPVAAPEIQPATQAIAPVTQDLLQTAAAAPPVIDPMVLPPPPVEEGLSEEEIPSGPLAQESSPEVIESTPEIQPAKPDATPGHTDHKEPRPHDIVVDPTATPTPTIVTEPVPVPTSAFLAKAQLAQKHAEEAQETAEGKEADRYAPSQYQEGLRLYTLGLESTERERYQTASKRFTEAAGAFIQAGSAAAQVRTAQEARTKARELVSQARVLAERRAYTQAEQAYLAYLQKVPQDAQISMEYGEMLTDRLSYSRGIQVLVKTLQMPSLLPVQSGRIHWRFAEGHRRSGNLQAAIQEIRQAIQYDPQNNGYISLLKQYQYEASEKQRVQQQRQGSQQNLIQDLTGSVLDSLIH